MTAPLDCPGIESWRALFKGTLQPDERERAERHLESCEACQGRLDRAEECGDPLLRLGREVGDPTLVPADPTLTHVLDRLREVKSGSRAAAVEPVDLFFLRPSDRPDSLGSMGHYEVTDVIGQGGMGVVLKAYDPTLHRLVAIKVMAPSIAGSASARRRFTREAQAAAAVCHDHVVTVHGVDAADGLPYLVMQYVPGESLQTRIDRAGTLELVEIVRIGLQTALGLNAAHAQGLIHRDIKPANLLLENGLAKVKITDFGLARMSDDVALTQNGVVAGTPEYMAPEQARGEPVDYRADLFSLGSVLYAMCTGVPPFRGPSTVAVLRRVSDHAPISIRELSPDIPDWLDDVVLRLMEKDPARRFQSAAEVAGLLEGYLAHLRQPKTIPAPEIPRSPMQLNRDDPPPRAVSAALEWVPLGIGLVSLLILAGLTLGFFLAKGDKKEAGPRPFQEYHLSLRGTMSDNPGIDLDGPDAEHCVNFETEGVRITLPRGWNGVRQNTGLKLPIMISGDCDITIHYEVFGEATVGVVPAQETRLTLGTSLEKEGLTVGTISRRADAKNGTQFMAWMSLPSAQPGKRQFKVKRFPAKTKEGWLRLSRQGSVLSYYASEGTDNDFTLLHQYDFGTEDLNHVHIAGSTGNARSALDVRVSDLHIRADSLPGQTLAQPSFTVMPARNRTWLTAAGIAGLVLTASLGLALWLTLRRQRLMDQGTADEESARPVRK